VRVPPDLVGRLIAFLLAAKVRGWIDVRSLDPVLRIIVEHDLTERTRELLDEIIERLVKIEAEMRAQ